MRRSSRLKEFPPGDGPPDFNVAHAIRVANDGMVYLADRENRRVQMFTSDGKFVKQLRQTAAPFAANLAFSPDPEQQFLYVGGGKAITIVDRKSLEVRGPGPGREAARRRPPHRDRLQGQSLHRATAAGMQRLLFKGPKTQSSAQSSLLRSGVRTNLTSTSTSSRLTAAGK